MTMSDDVVIKGYSDLISDSNLRGDDPDVVGLELQELGGDTDHLVAWLPGWLVDEKDVEPVGRSDNVVSGQVDCETGKAYLVVVDGDVGRVHGFAAASAGSPGRSVATARTRGATTSTTTARRRRGR